MDYSSALTHVSSPDMRLDTSVNSQPAALRRSAESTRTRPSKAQYAASPRMTSSPLMPSTTKVCPAAPEPGPEPTEYTVGVEEVPRPARSAMTPAVSMRLFGPKPLFQFSYSWTKYQLNVVQFALREPARDP